MRCLSLSLLALLTASCASGPQTGEEGDLRARQEIVRIAEQHPEAMRLSLSRIYLKKEAGARSEYMDGVSLEAGGDRPFAYLTALLFPEGGVETLHTSGQDLPEDTPDMVDALVELSQDYPLTREARLAKGLIEDIHPRFLCDETRKLFNAEKFLGIFDTTNYQEITQKVEFLLDAYPYHDCVREARLILADSQMRRGLVIEARSRYEEFLVLYPNDPQADYARYQMANTWRAEMSTNLFDDDFSIGRDPTALEKAQIQYGEFLARHRSSPHAGEALDRYGEIRRALAQDRLSIASLYERRGRWQAALVRLEEVMRDFRDTPESYEAALRKAAALSQLGQDTQAAGLLDQLIGAEPPPEYRERAREMKDRIENGGVSPSTIW